MSAQELASIPLLPSERRVKQHFHPADGVLNAALPGAGIAAENFQQLHPASSLPPSAPPVNPTGPSKMSHAVGCPQASSVLMMEAGSWTWENAPFILLGHSDIVLLGGGTGIWG